MKFIADSMVGRLAKWLRLMGYDTLYYPDIEDLDLLMIGEDENRIILTRDVLLLERRVVKRGINQVLFIKSERLFEQLEQLFDDLHIKPDFNKTRCKYDNNELVEVPKKAVKDKVPEYVYKTQEEFVKCNKCQRIYWKATQWQDIERRLEKLVSN